MATGYSFYGGKQGRTYHLVQHYDSIHAMVEAFQKGGSYTDANYNEYVIIDTIINKNNYSSPENGMIFRRGFNYDEKFNPQGIQLVNNTIRKEDTINGVKIYYDKVQDANGTFHYEFNEERFKTALTNFAQHPGGGAEYVGQIVGPQGESPELKLLKWDEFQKIYNDSNNAGNSKTLYVHELEAGKIEHNGTLQIQDNVRYGYCTIKDADGNVEGAVISFKIPYTVFEYTAESGSPYGPKINELISLPTSGVPGEYYKVGGKTYIWDTTAEKTVTIDKTTGVKTVTHGGAWVEATPWTAAYDEEAKRWKYTSLVREKAESKDHNYFKSYDITVPGGIRGTDVEKIAIDSTNKDQQYFYYKTRDYTHKLEGEESDQIKLGDYKVIAVHGITDNGHNAIYDAYKAGAAYKAGDIVSHPSLPSDIVMIATKGGASKGLSSIAKVVGSEIKDGDIIWRTIAKNYIPPDLLNVHYTAGEDDQIRIRVVDNLSWDEDGRLYVKYTDLNTRTYLGELQDIIGVTFDDSYPYFQNFVIHYNTYKRDGVSGNIVIDNTIEFTATTTDGKVVNKVWKLDDNGNVVGEKLELQYGTVKVTKYPTTDATGRIVEYIPEQIKFIQSIECDNDGGDTDGTITITYNTGEVIKPIQLHYYKNLWMENAPGEKNGTIYTKDNNSVINPIGQIKYFDKIELDNSGTPSDGTLTITDNTGKTKELGKLQYYKDIKIDNTAGAATNGDVTVTDNTNAETKIGHLKYVDTIKRDEETGLVTTTYNDTSEDNDLGYIKSLRDVNLDEDRKIAVTWSTKDNSQGDKSDADGYDVDILDLKITTPNKIWLDNEDDIDKEKKIKVNYNVGKHNSDNTESDNGIGDTQDIATHINYIVDACLYGDNLCLLWADPDYRENLTNYYKLTREGKLLETTDSSIQIYKWENLGPILEGNHIIGNFESLLDLRYKYPNGFGTDDVTKNRAGWVATVSKVAANGDTIVEIYAYDYIGDKGWYKIQDLSSSNINPHYTMLVAASQETENKPDHPDENLLNAGGYWFVVSQ